MSSLSPNAALPYSTLCPQMSLVSDHFRFLFEFYLGLLCWVHIYHGMK